MHSSPEIVPANDFEHPQLIYIASPLRSFRSPRYLRLLAKMGDCFSEAEFIIGRDASLSGDGRASWPFILRQCAAMCVIPDHEGWISQGVWNEIWDIVKHDKIVVIVAEDGRIGLLDHIVVTKMNPDNHRRFARLAFRRTALRTGGA